MLSQNATYPIFRAGPIEYIYDLLKEIENIKEPEEQGSFFVPKNEDEEIKEVDEIGDYNIPDEIH